MYHHDTASAPSLRCSGNCLSVRVGHPPIPNWSQLWLAAQLMSTHTHTLSLSALRESSTAASRAQSPAHAPMALFVYFHNHMRPMLPGSRPATSGKWVPGDTHTGQREGPTAKHSVPPAGWALHGFWLVPSVFPYKPLLAAEPLSCSCAAPTVG